MKRLIAFALTLCLCFGLLACGAEPAATQPSEAQTTAATEPAGPSQAAIDALDGKKILFIGNSYTFFGRCVINAGDELTQENRSGDKGLFYHLCKLNGIDVEVTNWTFGSHDLTDITTEECKCKSTVCFGMNHLAYLKDRHFDYVAIQASLEKSFTGDLATHLQPTMDLFREANPDVKFLFLVPHMAFVRQDFRWSGGNLVDLADTDITICNWGGMVNDIITKVITVPGATEQHWKGTYVVSKSEQDGHHENLLAGYLTSLMVYCAITGESAVGQPYAFCDDTSLNAKFGIDQYKQRNYVYDPVTNFDAVLRSEPDMLGLQQLVDKYLAKYN